MTEEHTAPVSEPQLAPAAEAASDHVEAANGSEMPPASEKTTPARPKSKARADVTDTSAIISSSGGRQRKQVQHFKPEALTEVKKLTVAEGKGAKLRDIPNVYFKLNKISGKEELMELLHDILYRRKGQASTRKRDILDFSGFVFAPDSKEAELEKVTAKVARLKSEALNQLLDIFELPRGSSEEGHKDAKVKRIVAWLHEPKATSKKDLAAESAKKREAAKRKREKQDKAKEKEEKATKKAKSAKSPSAKGTGDAAKPKKARKKKNAQPEEGEAEEADSDSDDELPLGAVAKLPSDKALVKQVQAILSTVDVQEFNLKALMAQLAEHYGTDLAPKKPLIKTTAIRYCLEHPPEGGGADEEAEDEEEDAEEAEEEADAEGKGEEAAAEEEPVADMAEAAADTGKADAGDAAGTEGAAAGDEDTAAE